MSQSVLLVDRKDGIATLTLNRPEQMNALSMELRRVPAEALEALRYDADVGVVILTGAGCAFCAGLDLKEMGGERAAEAPERDRQVALARDMLSCVPDVLFEYKSLIDRGFDLAPERASTASGRRRPSDAAS